MGFWNGKSANAEAVEAGQNKLLREEKDRFRRRNGVVRHKDGSVDVYTEVVLERDRITEARGNDGHDFHVAASVFNSTALPTPRTLFPRSELQSPELDEAMMDIKLHLGSGQKTGGG